MYYALLPTTFQQFFKTAIFKFPGKSVKQVIIFNKEAR